MTKRNIERKSVRYNTQTTLEYQETAYQVQNVKLKDVQYTVLYQNKKGLRPDRGNESVSE